jgi:hypothetical protein
MSALIELLRLSNTEIYIELPQEGNGAGIKTSDETFETIGSFGSERSPQAVVQAGSAKKDSHAAALALSLSNSQTYTNALESLLVPNEITFIFERRKTSKSTSLNRDRISGIRPSGMV